MPSSAYALVATFAGISLLSGVLAARVVGPWRWWSAIVPTLAAFAVLYLAGHRWALSVGPQVRLYGWQVSLPFDIAVALVAAGLAAGLQRTALRRSRWRRQRAGGA